MVPGLENDFEEAVRSKKKQMRRVSVSWEELFLSFNYLGKFKHK
jgi:hypothetical protein